MAIPEGYRLLTANDVGKTFGVELESTVYFDTSTTPSYIPNLSSTNSSFNYTNFLVAEYTTMDQSYITFITCDGNVVWNFGIFTEEQQNLNAIQITSYNTNVEWNNWFYVKDNQKVKFISDMNSLGKSITDKAGASGKKSIAELKDLVDNLKTTFTEQEKTVTPSKTSQVITPDSGYDGLSKVTVNVIPSSYIIPSGTLAISENGTKDVTQYASVNVNVPTPEPTYWDGTYIEEELASGYTLTLNCDNGILNTDDCRYSLDSGTTWNQFTSNTTTLENVEKIRFKTVGSGAIVGTSSGGYDIIALTSGAESEDLTITEDTTWYISITSGGAGA